MEDRARCIFGNEIAEKDYEKACKTQEANAKKFCDDSALSYHLCADDAPVVGSRLGVRWLRLSESGAPFDIAADAVAASVAVPEPSAAPFSFAPIAPATGKPVVVGNIRMGFGHYRIAMAMASAARALGYVPYWFDLCAFEGSTCSKLVQYQNKLYSMGSRLSQKVAPFNALYWEPLNSEGFRKLTYNAGDQKNAELMATVYNDLPSDVPFVGTHAWPSQAAVHAGLTHVVNAIPDNWPMALHLAEGSVHAVQTPGAYLGYKMLRGMDPKRQLNPMPQGSVVETGHYIDHELVMGIPSDCAARRQRMESGAPVRYLVCVGGAGAQQDLIAQVLEHLAELVEAGEATLLVNVGDHADVWRALVRRVPALKTAQLHFDDFGELEAFAACGMTPDQLAAAGCGAGAGDGISGIHAFCDKDIFSAVYSTNILMRVCDVLVTKPSELAFYPVPKLMIRRVGGHEAWGAICAAELGDGTYELETAPEICAMIDAFQADRSLIAGMCRHIEASAEMGTYDGAYRAVQLAVS